MTRDDVPAIRSAVLADAPVLLAIYRPFVESILVSFETQSPTVEEFSARIAKALAGWAWLVAEHEGRCVGYAYASTHRERAAVGRKFGAWHDVAWLQRRLREAPIAE